MFRFAHSWFLYALIALPVLVILYWLMLRWRKKSIQAFGDVLILQKLFPNASRQKRNLKFALLLSAVGLMVIGIADPQIGSKLEEVKRKGVDIVIALDVSNSMNAEDIRPNRLERAKQAISRLVDKLQNDRIGIVVFAGKSYVQLPITSDFSAAKLCLSSIQTDMIPTQGTAIGDAIRTGLDLYNEDDKNHRAMIVVTDGENHEDDALSAAKEADSAGVILHSIGMGSPAGAPIPIFYNGVQAGFKKDQSGNTVVTKLDESLLQELANVTKGKYVRASTADDGFASITAEIDKMEKKELGSKMFTDYEDRFYYFLAAALIIMISELFITEKKSMWWAKLNLFGENAKN